MPSSVKRSTSSRVVNSSSSLARRPAEQREEVHHAFADVALPLVLHHRRRAVALAQALLVGPHDERHVRERGHGRVERLVEQHLLRRVRDVIVAADDVRDRHVDVVHDDGQVIRGMTIRAEDDEALDVLVVERDRAVDEIRERRLSRRHLEANRAFVPVGETARRAAAQPRRGTCPAARDWKYGACGPPTSGPSSQSRPSQRRPVEDARRPFPPTSAATSVSSMRRTNTPPWRRDVEPVEQRRASAADVEIAGRRRSEAEARNAQASSILCYSWILARERPSRRSRLPRPPPVTAVGGAVTKRFSRWPICI